MRARLHTLPRHHQFYDVIGNPESLKQLQDLHAYHEVFASLAGDRAMEVLAEALLGEPAVLRNIQYFNKPPLTSKPTPPHQDGSVARDTAFDILLHPLSSLFLL